MTVILADINRAIQKPYGHCTAVVSDRSVVLKLIRRTLLSVNDNGTTLSSSTASVLSSAVLNSVDAVS